MAKLDEFFAKDSLLTQRLAGAAMESEMVFSKEDDELFGVTADMRASMIKEVQRAIRRHSTATPLNGAVESVNRNFQNVLRALTTDKYTPTRLWLLFSTSARYRGSVFKAGRPHVVDGKKKDSTYSAKHAERVFKFQVFCTLRGIPLSVSAAEVGCKHDINVMRAREPFPHVRDEVWLADLGYVGANHCVHEWKKNEFPQHAEDAATFDHEIGVVRSRIERLFSQADAWKIMHGTDRDVHVTTGLVRLVFALLYWRLRACPSYEANSPRVPSDWNASVKCGCAMQPDRHLIDEAKRRRLHFMRHLRAIGCMVDPTKKPRKGKKREREAAEVAAEAEEVQADEP